MDEFLRKIKDNLDSRPEPAFDPKAWNALEKKMEEDGSGTKAGLIPWWWLPAALLPILLLNGMFLWQNNEKQTTIKTEVVLQKDTIYKTQVVYKSDTVFLTKNNIKEVNVPVPVQVATTPSDLDIQRWIQQNLLVENTENSNDKNGAFLKEVYQLLNDKFAPENKADELVNKEPILQEVFDINSEVELLEQSGMNYLTLNDQLPDNLLVNADYKKKKSLRKKLYDTKELMKPKSLALGANGGFSLPTTMNLESKAGYTTGISAIIGFGSNLRILGDFNYNFLPLTSEDPNERFGLPDIPSRPDNFIFEEAVADQTSVETGIGFQYLIAPTEKWKPYIGLSYNVLRIFPYEVEYTFKNIDTDDEFISPQEVDHSALITNLGNIQGGVEWNFWKNFNLQGEVYYRRNLFSANALTPNIVGSKMRLLYQF